MLDGLKKVADYCAKLGQELYQQDRDSECAGVGMVEEWCKQQMAQEMNSQAAAAGQEPYIICFYQKDGLLVAHDIPTGIPAAIQPVGFEKAEDVHDMLEAMFGKEHRNSWYFKKEVFSTKED